MDTTARYRITSIDILRGLVMIIMAIDHIRDAFHQPAMITDPLNPHTTTIPIFFTRWITHFCAPTFLFLSGISAYLSSLRKTKKQAAIFLVKRGVWLIIMELTIIGFGITLNPFFNVIILQVIWAIGCSMIILGLLSLISYNAILITGIVLFFGHDLFLGIIQLPQTGTAGVLSKIFFTAFASIFPISNTHIVIDFYAVLPWTSAMLIGYSMGRLFTKEISAVQRKRFLLITGTILIFLFLILRSFRLYGDVFPRQEEPTFLQTLFSFLSASKYPPSLQYFCMTLGPACLFLALFDHVKNKFTDFMSVYGRVPFFYYVLHWYTFHIILIIVFFATGHTAAQINDQNSVFYFRPVTFGFGLPVVYTIWLFVIAVLYLPCRWFGNYKKTHNQWWLSYV